MTAIIIIGTIYLVTYVTDVIVKSRLRYWQRRLAEATLERVEIDGRSFDSSLKWAYVRGYADARHGLDIQVGVETIAIEHRAEFPSTSP